MPYIQLINRRYLTKQSFPRLYQKSLKKNWWFFLFSISAAYIDVILKIEIHNINGCLTSIRYTLLGVSISSGIISGIALFFGLSAGTNYYLVSACHELLWGILLERKDTIKCFRDTSISGTLTHILTHIIKIDERTGFLISWLCPI